VLVAPALPAVAPPLDVAVPEAPPESPGEAAGDELQPTAQYNAKSTAAADERASSIGVSVSDAAHRIDERSTVVGARPAAQANRVATLAKRPCAVVGEEK